MRNLSQTLYRLRRVLNDVSDSPWLLVTNQTLQFNPASEHQLDVLAFERTVIAARPGDWGEQPAREQIEQLAAAATLYRGELLPNVTVADSALFEEWLLLKRERLHQLALNAFGQLTTAALAIGNTLDAQSYAQQQLTLDPWRETAHRQLMEAFVQNGQRTAALRQYERCREILLAELGVEPEPATTTLYAEIQGGRFGAPTEAAVSVPNTISTQPIGISPPINISFPFDIPLRGDWSEMPNQGQFYGRENEMATLCQRLTTVGCRLVVVTGMGGIGKTALAAHAVQTVLSHFTVVIWQSLLNAPTLAELLPHWLQLVAGQPVTVPTTVNGQIDCSIWG